MHTSPEHFELKANKTCRIKPWKTPNTSKLKAYLPMICSVGSLQPSFVYAPCLNGVETPFLLFQPAQKQKNHRSPVCPRPLSRCISLFFLATWVHHTWSRAIYTRTSQNQSFNKSLLWYLNQASDLRLPLCSQESTGSFRATFVWLMCLRWIRSSRKPFKLQSPAFQSNTGGTMQRGEKTAQRVLGWSL